jgi:hypothetical protein
MHARMGMTAHKGARGVREGGRRVAGRYGARQGQSGGTGLCSGTRVASSRSTSPVPTPPDPAPAPVLACTWSPRDPAQPQGIVGGGRAALARFYLPNLPSTPTHDPGAVKGQSTPVRDRHIV